MKKYSANQCFSPGGRTARSLNSLPLRGSADPEERPAQSSGTRVLVVIEDGFRDSRIVETLQREHHEIFVARASDAIVREAAGRKFDLILLCSRRSGRECREILEQITDTNPTVPVIVVTAPGVAARELDTPMQTWRESTNHVDASLLLRTVRETLRGPAVKRLIRVTERSGGARYVARNARWLSEDLQARYSTPFEWGLPSMSIPVRFENVSNLSSAQS